MTHTKRTFMIILFCILALFFNYIPVNAASNKNTKKKYYKEYQKIIKDANKKLGKDDFSLLPIQEIKEKNMLTPKDFKKSINAWLAIERTSPVISNSEFSTTNNSSDIQLLSIDSGTTVSASKYAPYKLGNVSVKVTCNATFVTKYKTASKRRVIASIKKYSSSVSGSKNSWAATPDSSKSIIDGGRTAVIRYTGVLKNSSGYTKKVAPVFYFYCDAGGAID